MAYEYDQLGNVIGEYESEEERRRREAANQPVKQTTVYNPDGTQEVTIKGTPEALSPINPNTPTLYAPGENAGADQFASQAAATQIPTMPAMAAQPGTQVAGTMQMPVDREQQRRAILQSEAARIQQQLQATQDPAVAERLQRDAAALQREMSRGQPGMQRVSAQPPRPQPAPVAPTAMPPAAPAATQQPPASYVTGGMPSNQGIRIPGLTPVGQMPTPVDSTTQAINRYQQIQDNPEELMKLGYSQDPAVPEFLRNRARGRTAELITQQREMAAAKEQIPNMSESDIAAALRKKTTGGDYFKAVVFGILGMENSAQAEAAKLGIGRETFTTINGQPAIVKMATNGTPIEGYNATTGKRLSASELVAAAQSTTLMKGANIGSQVYRDPVTNETLTKVDTQQGPIYYNKSQQRVVPKGEPVPLTAGSDVATQLQLSQMKRQQAFVGQTAEARIRAYNETNNERALAGMAPLTPAQMGINANGELIGQPQPTVPQLQQPPGMAPPAPQGPAPAPQQQPAPQGPAPAPQQQPAPQGGMTPAQMQAQRKGREEVVKKAADTIAGADKIVSELVSVERAATDVLTKKNNFGTIISGMIPGEQTIGEVFRTQDYINTQNVLDIVNKQAAVNAKMLGTNPTDRDLQFVTATKPDKNWPPDAVADWLRKSADGTRRTLDFARSQMQSGGTYIPETPQAAPPAATVPPANQFRIISVTPGPK